MGEGLELRRRLNAFDVTSLVVGSIIGADIYVAAALGARLVGPFSLLIWLAAGLMAIVIALSFSYSAAILPRVGGPYSYAREVLGPFAGFVVGWALLLSEWFSLAVFPVAFARYLVAMAPWLGPNQVPLKAAFIAVVLATNVFGVKAAGRFNDYLTVGKLAPLILLMGAGLVFMGLNPGEALSNFRPFIKGTFGDAGQALVLIFWAYAGFELSTLPADEVREPERTIPRAIVMGMLIVAVFYMVTNFVIIGVVDEGTLASSTAPLMTAGRRVFGLSPSLSVAGGLIVGMGALVSIMGSDESGTIGTSRLSYAMALDGLLPRLFGRLHPRYKTPYLGLIFLCLTALVASVMGSLTDLINASVFLLAFSYLATCVSTLLLEGRYPDRSRNVRGRRAIPILGALFSFILMTQVSVSQVLTSLVLLSTGVPTYVFFSPKHELREPKKAFLSGEAVLRRAYEQGERFLAHLVRHVIWYVYRVKKVSRAWGTKEKDEAS